MTRSLFAALDARDIAPGTLRLRAERKGNGDGRVYLIVASATDGSGNGRGTAVRWSCRTGRARGGSAP
jgi:hypothetical protein